MKKMKKNTVQFMAAFVLMIAVSASFAGAAFAAIQEQHSYLKATSSFLASEDYWKYKNLGIIYTNSTCKSSNAAFDVTYRKYKDEKAVFYKNAGTLTNCSANIAKGTYAGNVLNGIGDSSAVFRNYYKLKNNGKNEIYARDFVKYSRDY